MYKITNLKFRVCIVIHETRYTIHETRRFRVSTSQLYVGRTCSRLIACHALTTSGPILRALPAAGRQEQHCFRFAPADPRTGHEVVVWLVARGLLHQH